MDRSTIHAITRQIRTSLQKRLHRGQGSVRYIPAARAASLLVDPWLEASDEEFEWWLGRHGLGAAHAGTAACIGLIWYELPYPRLWDLLSLDTLDRLVSADTAARTKIYDYLGLGAVDRLALLA